MIGWTLTGLVGLVVAFSGFMKLAQSEEVVAQAAAVGLNAQTYFMIGVVEIISLILFIIPRTGILGTLLLAAYFGGAIVTHLLAGQPIWIALVVQVMVWIAAVIRFPELRLRLLTAAPPKLG